MIGLAITMGHHADHQDHMAEVLPPDAAAGDGVGQEGAPQEGEQRGCGAD